MINFFLLTLIIFCFIKTRHFLPDSKTITKKGIRDLNLMTTSQKSSRKISLEMKSEVHYKKAAKSYRKSEQYIKMINLYPTLQNTLIECKDESLVE